MRDKFRSLGDLMGYYQFVKLKMESCPAILPSQNSNFNDRPSAQEQQSRKEDMLCFIGDVELFAKDYYNQQTGYFPIPFDCIREIFFFTFASDIWLAMAFPNKIRSGVEWNELRNKFCTFGQLAKRFKGRIANKERIPRRLAHRGYLCNLCSDMRKKAEEYFADFVASNKI